MTENEITELLNSYIEAEMSLINLQKYQLDNLNISPSKKFKKRIKIIMTIEKYFGKHLTCGYVFRYVAVFAASLLTLFGANQVSAKFFGFNPWGYIYSYINESKMEQRRFVPRKHSETIDKKMIAVRDVPSYIPKGMIEEQSEKVGDDVYIALWLSKNKQTMIQYERDRITDGTTIATDAEYSQKERCVVAGYECFYYQKKEEKWIEWSDEKYFYQLFVTGLKSPKTEMIKMAQSIYNN